jgi:hypothetical protein
MLGGEIEIGRGEPMEVADRVLGRHLSQAGRHRLDRLPVHRQDQAVEVAKLVIDAPDGAVGGLRYIPNLQ